LRPFHHIPLEIRPELTHIFRERMTGRTLVIMAACTNSNARVEPAPGFALPAADGFGLSVHITAAQTTRGVIATRDTRRPVATHPVVAGTWRFSPNWKVIF
jgi:hypothetical protein